MHRGLLRCLGWISFACVTATGGVAFAIELGAARGTPILGRTLDVLVTVTGNAAGEETCPEVQLYFGEARTASVLTWRPGVTEGTGVLRVTSSKPVDEPVVTVYATAGCQSRVSRKYVFFTELDTNSSVAAPVVISSLLEVAKTAPASTSVASGQSQVLVPSGAATSGSVSIKQDALGVHNNVNRGTSTLGAPEGVRPEQVKRKAKRQPDAAVASGEESKFARRLTPQQTHHRKGAAQEGGTSKSSRSAQASRQSARSRLKLEPLDLLVEPTPVLRSTLELQTTTLADPVARKAAAELWRAINMSAEDILRDSARSQALEAQLLLIKGKLAAQQEAAAKLQTEADDQKFQKYLAWGLAVLCAAGAALAIAISRRSESKTPWWQEFNPVRKKSKGEESEYLDIFADDGLDEFTRMPPAPSPTTTQPLKQDKSQAKTGASSGGPTSGAAKSSDFSLSILDSLSSAGGDSRLHSGYNPRRLKKRDAQDSNFGVVTAKDFDVQELFDVQEQADFFVSVGQHDQAIEALRSHIEGSPYASAVAYLDLFALYHKLNRKEDYEALTEDFNEDFSAEVPSFEQYGSSGRKHLDDYPAAISRIQMLWPTAKALDVIAESIFRKPDNSEASFGLEAYRELLLLYAILKDILDASGGSAAPEHAPSGMLAPDLQFDVAAPAQHRLSAESAERTVSFNLPPEGGVMTQLHALPAEATDPVAEEGKALDLPPLDMNLPLSKELQQVSAASQKNDPYRPKASRRLGLDIDLSTVEDDVRKSGKA